MAGFIWNDPLLFEDQLSEEERQIRDVARNFAQGELAPLIVDWNRREYFDPEIMKEFGKLGFLGATIPDYGCAGISNVAYGLVAREMERSILVSARPWEFSRGLLWLQSICTAQLIRRTDT